MTLASGLTISWRSLRPENQAETDTQKLVILVAGVANRYRRLQSKFPTGPASYASNCIIDLACKIRYCRYQIFLTFRSPTFPTLKPMADPANCLPLTPDSIREVHSIIKPHIHSTPVLTCLSLDRIASNPSRPGALAPKFRLFFKCENLYR